MDIENSCIEEKNNHTKTAQKTNIARIRRLKQNERLLLPIQIAFIHIELSLFSFAMVERMAEELMEWPAKNPTAKTITEFYLSKGLTQQTYNRLVIKYDFLKEAHETTMRRLGERLWGRAVDNEANWKPVQFMLHNYAPEFKEANEYHYELNKKTEGSKYQPITVIMTPIPNSDLVPEKPRIETE